MNREQQLREFGRLISALSAGHVMSREESFEAYRQVILDLQPELQQGAFLSAHFMRNPTIEELSGAWDALSASLCLVFRPEQKPENQPEHWQQNDESDPDRFFDGACRTLKNIEHSIYIEHQNDNAEYAFQSHHTISSPMLNVLQKTSLLVFER